VKILCDIAVSADSESSGVMFIDDTFGEIEFEDILVEKDLFVGTEAAKTIDKDVFFLSETVGSSDRLLIVNWVPR
jgi:hypothetical protein